MLSAQHLIILTRQNPEIYSLSVIDNIVANI